MPQYKESSSLFPFSSISWRTRSSTVSASVLAARITTFLMAHPTFTLKSAHLGDCPTRLRGKTREKLIFSLLESFQFISRHSKLYSKFFGAVWNHVVWYVPICKMCVHQNGDFRTILRCNNKEWNRTTEKKSNLPQKLISIIQPQIQSQVLKEYKWIG